VGISSDGKTVMTSSSGDGTAIFWDAATGEKRRTFQGKIKPDDASNRFSTAGLSPDGRYLVTGAFDSTVTFWDAQTGKKIVEDSDHHSQEINSIAFSRDGKRVVTSSWANVNVWETSNGKQLNHFSQLIGFTRVAINGNLILAGTEDNTTQIRDASTGKHLRTLGGHTDPAISNDGQFAWTTSDDGTTRLWRVRDGQELLRMISFEESDDWLAITPDGHFDGSDEVWKIINYREASSGKLIDAKSVQKMFHHHGSLMDRVNR
jgi:WD40 repeat protein